jgi:hypothetical protein
MSIHLLKRKTDAVRKTLSTGQPVFSLTGGHRNQGYVGQDLRGRSLVRSLYRNGALKNHGGCCGQLPENGIVRSPDLMCVNDADVVKASTVSTHGMLMQKHRWLRRPAPYATVKPDDGRHLGEQGLYINIKARRALLAADNVDQACPEVDPPARSADCELTHPQSCPPVSKPWTRSGKPVYTGEEYIRKLNRKCAHLDVFVLPKNTQQTPFACSRLIVAV